MLWEVQRMPQPLYAARFLILSRMICAADGSREAVGSSRSSSRGRLMRALASAARVC
jgi:hypothetical protein